MRPLPQARLWPSPRPRPRRPALLNHATRAAAVASRQSPRSVLPNLRISRPSRTKEHESRIRQPGIPALSQVQSLLLDFRGAVVHLRHQLANLISLPDKTPKHARSKRSSASLYLRLRCCPLLITRLLLVTRITIHAPPDKSQHGRDNFPSLVQCPEHPALTINSTSHIEYFVV